MQVALYARVSTTRQADNDLSIPDQLKQLRSWCEQNGHVVAREFVEPGASATDDKRPVFQNMLGEALDKSPAFEAIIIHSLSRFFRDHIEFGIHERRLLKNGIRIISITQQTSDDAAGEMARRLFSLFDEYQSKENAKHTSRAMCENARQGFFNGARAPFGYQAVVTDIAGTRGRKKKRLEIYEPEAILVRNMYHLYLNGYQGRNLGIKEIVKHLTARGQLMRGNPWSIQKVHEILSSRAYLGEHYFNVRNSKTGETRPPSEWITVHSEPIIDLETFERVAALREARSPRKTPARRVASPHLLTGLLKCTCGHHFTAVTGKSGRYLYYKCANRQSKGNHACTSKNYPMDRLDDAITQQFAERVCSTERLLILMAELRKRMQGTKNDEQKHVQALNAQLKKIEQGQRNLLAAIENGLPFDEVLQKRSQELKSERESLLIELSSVRRSLAVPMERILPSNVEAFSKAVRAKLKDRHFAKRYLQVLVDEIVLDGETATMKGSYAALANAIAEKKKGTSDEVPSFLFDWRARSDSNARPLGS